MGKKKQKHQSNKSQNNITTWIRKFWWVVAIGALIVVIPIFLSFKAALDERAEQQRFSEAYEQMVAFYGGMNSSSLESSKSLIANRCERIYSGFVGYIECGTFVDFLSEYGSSEEIRNSLLTKLAQYGFVNVDVKIGDNANDGSASFETKLGLNCEVYWVYDKEASSQSKVVQFDGYCRDYTPRLLDGYEVVE